MTKKQISNNQKIRKMIDLIQLAELNINICSKLYKDHINKNDPNNFRLARLIANNSFNNTISILHTLLVSSNKRELSIEPILQKENGVKISELKRIQNNFEKYDLLKVRHQSVAHKNELLTEPASESSLLLQEIYIIRVEKVV